MLAQFALFVQRPEQIWFISPTLTVNKLSIESREFLTHHRPHLNSTAVKGGKFQIIIQIFMGEFARNWPQIEFIIYFPFPFPARFFFYRENFAGIKAAENFNNYIESASQGLQFDEMSFLLKIEWKISLIT